MLFPDCSGPAGLCDQGCHNVSFGNIFHNSNTVLDPLAPYPVTPFCQDGIDDKTEQIARYDILLHSSISDP